MDGLGSVASIIHPYTGVVGRILLVIFSRKVSFRMSVVGLGVVFSFMALVGSKSLTSVEPIRQSHGGVCTVVSQSIDSSEDLVVQFLSPYTGEFLL